MSREVIVKNWCDLHQGRDGSKVEAVAVETVSLGNVRRELDLCADHAAEVAETVGELLKFGGPLTTAEPIRRGPARGASQPGPDDPQDCPVCGFTSKNPVALGAHARAQHGLNAKQLRDLMSGAVAPPQGLQASG